MKVTKEQQTKIIIDSITERLVLEFIAPHLNTFTPEYISNPFGTDSWDCTFSSGETTNKFTSVSELKIKEKYSLDNFRTAFIKQNKYYSLMHMATSEKAIKNSTQPTYINVFKDGVVVYNLFHFPPALMKWVNKDWPLFEADWSHTKKEYIGELPLLLSIEKKKIKIPLAELKQKAVEIYNQYHSTYPKHIRYFHINDPTWKQPNTKK